MIERISKVVQLARQHALGTIMGIVVGFFGWWIPRMEDTRTTTIKLETSHVYDREAIERLERKIDLLLRQFGLAADQCEESDLPLLPFPELGAL